MAAPRIDRRTLSRAKPINLLRLAKYINIPIKDNCVCGKCNATLVEEVVRRLDAQDNKSSYEEIIKRLENKYK